MKGLRRHPFRVTGRFLWFAWTVLAAVADYLWRCAFRDDSLSARANWLHRSSQRTLKIFKFSPRITGIVPQNGLLISNHLGYLDILLIASITPAAFVSKRDVKSWPVMGWLAQLAGTVFIDRERRTHVGPVNREIQKALQAGVLVVIFPEGTSTDGREILPFKSSLLELATRREHPLTASRIAYGLDVGDGDAADEVCYWGDHAFFPHLLNLLGKRAVRASVCFMPVPERAGDRKELARQLHGVVSGACADIPGAVSSSQPPFGPA